MTEAREAARPAARASSENPGFPADRIDHDRRGEAGAMRSAGAWLCMTAPVDWSPPRLGRAELLIISYFVNLDLITSNLTYLIVSLYITLFVINLVLNTLENPRLEYPQPDCRLKFPDETFQKR
jgi:hypothetical protein